MCIAQCATVLLFVTRHLHSNDLTYLHMHHFKLSLLHNVQLNINKNKN